MLPDTRIQEGRAERVVDGIYGSTYFIWNLAFCHFTRIVFYFSRIKRITRIYIVASVEICEICVSFLMKDVSISHGLNRLHGFILFICGNLWNLCELSHEGCFYFSRIKQITRIYIVHLWKSVKFVWAFSWRMFLFLTDLTDYTDNSALMHW